MALDVQRVNSGVDVREPGKRGALDRRLFFQLLAFGNCRDSRPIVEAVRSTGQAATIYADISDPLGIAVVMCSEQPDYFVDQWRSLLQHAPFDNLTPKPELTMFGRTYSIGYEESLEETLIDTPLRKLSDPNMPWAIWYPLRRRGSFEQLAADEQRKILMEHGGIGMAFGRAGHGTDIRLACHGLDRNDNDFVIALLGPELAPLSKIVERMRKTKQTSQYLESLGPFFIGKAIWQSRN